MKNQPDRAVLTVSLHEGQWFVDHDGEQFGHSIHREEAKAAANRRARALQDDGQPCQVRTMGEHGFWPAT